MQRPVRDDARRDGTGVALLAVVGDHLRQAGLGVLVDDTLGGQRLSAVHAHVERRVTPVGEPPFGEVQLRAADAEVKQDSHDISLACLSHDLGDVFEATVHDPCPVTEGFELGSGRRDCRRISIDPEEAEVRSSLQEPAGMPTATDRRIHDGPCWHRGEELDHLPDHDR